MKKWDETMIALLQVSSIIGIAVALFEAIAGRPDPVLLLFSLVCGLRADVNILRSKAEGK